LPQTLHPYVYVNNNPINLTDPSGEFVGDILDVASFFWSLDDFLRCPTWENAAWLGLDVLGLLPIIPALGMVRRVGSHLDDLSDVRRILKTGENALDARRTAQTARQLGLAGETAAGIVKNTTRIDSLTGIAKYRVPDVLNRSAQLIGEVKNVSRLSYTNQLRDFVRYAKQQGFRFELMARQGTRLSTALQQAIDAGGIILLRILP
jgi:hypothetical protein